MSFSGRFEKSAERIYYSFGAFHYLHEFGTYVGGTGFLGAVAGFYKGSHLAVPVLLISLFAFALGTAFRFRRIAYRLQGPNPGLEIQTLQITYSLLGNSKYQEIREITATAIHDGVDHYQHKFAWSGDGDIKARLEVPAGGKAEITSESLGTLRVCRSTFDRPLGKSEKIATRTILDFDDSARTSKPFLSLVVNDWIHDALTLRVRFAADAPQKVKKRIYISSVSEIPIDDDFISLASGSQEAAWEIPHPKPYYKYQLSW